VKKVLYVCYLQNYFRGLTQRTHHLINFMANQEDIGSLDVIHINNSNEKIDIVKKHIGKITFYGINTLPAIPWGLNHLVSPLKVFISFLKNNKMKYDYIVAESPWGGLVAILLKLFGKTKIVIYEDMDFFPGFYTKSKIRNIIVKFLEWLVIKNADLVISVGNELANIRRRITKKEVYVSPNGVFYDKFARALQKQEHPPTLIYMGNIEEWAGVDLPIRALPRLLEKIPNLRYMVVGDGPFLEKIKQLSEELGVADHVDFVGLQPYDNLPNYLSKADIGIATYLPIDLMKYAFTLKVVEYGAAGLPVIATKIGETTKYISKNRTGILINRNEDEFYEAVIKLFENKQLYHELSTNGTKKAKLMDWDIILKKRYTMIDDFLKSYIK